MKFACIPCLSSGSVHNCRLTLMVFATLLLIGCATTDRETAGSAASPETNTAAVPDMAAPSDSSSSLFNSDFWAHWGDGQAELNAYELVYPRYGALREGTAVAIFVTEPFANSLRVKADPGKHPPENEFPVMKLNLLEGFQTGIYNYNIMTSTFLALKAVNGRPAGRSSKISFTSQEWCGHVYHQLLFDQNRVRSTSHSYFDGEADEQRDLAAPRSGIAEDELLLWARGMAEPRLNAGESRSLPFLPSVKQERLFHDKLGWSQVRLSRAPEPQTITVPAGEFEVDVLTAELDRGKTRTYYVETAAPHRVIKWTSSEGESAELLGSKRAAYWELNNPSGSQHLRDLGLEVRPGRTM
jgi:hypothetical protein